MPRKEQRPSRTARAPSEPDSGLYLLVLKLAAPAKVRVGAIGKIEFRPGYYVYCGSARRNLSARLVRHKTRRKKRHWHIDYLTCRRDVRVESVIVFPSDGMGECELYASALRLARAEPIPGFGCSDCRCGSHLAFAGAEKPDLKFRNSIEHEIP